MELHSVRQPFLHSHLGEEKHQMLNLNQRLEAYLGRVKVLEEENELLHKEIQALRRSNQGASSRRTGLEKELRRARMEVDAAWRERDQTEMEVGSLTEELQALGLHGQREAEARMEARTKLEESRREMEEEQRAQIWLRETVNQLENEIQLMIQTHQEDVAHLEATLTHSRHAMPPTHNQMPNLLQLGQEYSQRASRAWQEAAEAYQGQAARLEESLNQARSRLTQVGQEKSESQLKLQTLQKEIGSAQDTRLHLEKTAAQQRDRHNQEIQQLQEHLAGLEAEREELGRQIDRLLVDNRGLLQLKMSLGLEVATYRALLDNESLRGDISSVNQPRNIYITDAVSSRRGVKENYQTQLSTSHKTTPLSSVHSVRSRSKPAMITTTSIWTRRPVTLNETPEIYWKKTIENQIGQETAKSTKSTTWATPYPKVLQSGTVEHFRPQEVHEEVTYAEPLSPPNEQEPLAESLVGSSHRETTAGEKESEEDWSILDAGPPEEGPVVESTVSYQVESGLSCEPPFNNEIRQHQYTVGNLTSYHVQMTEEPFGFSDESGKDVPFEVPAKKEEMHEPHAPIDAWVEKELMIMGKEAEHVHEETSDSETEAVLEPTLESSTSSPASECEPEESMFDQPAEFSQEDISNDVAGVISQQIRGSMARTNEKEFEDKLYPDGEEMDTWDSVIERKVDLKKDDGMKKDEIKTQHAEPEEDISAREPEHEEKEIREEVASIVQHDDNMTSSLIDTKLEGNGQHALSDQEHVQLPDKDEEENDEEEDSQNVSVSWRTELESDSYAQDNTLADTRPLIRYKSDETDANTQASHMDESESSEGEEDKKDGETGSGIWSESKSKRFGTMEDLCEEAEGEALDEEYDLGYIHIEDRDVGHDRDISEHATLENDEKSAEVEHSDEEMEELTKPVEPVVFSDVDYDEELESVDRLVEQELESLSTATYSAHFTQQQANESEAVLNLQEEEEEEEEADKRREDMFSCAEPEVTAHHKLTSSTTVMDQPYEHLYFSDTSVEMLHTNALAEEEVQHKDQGTVDAPEKREEEEEPNLSMVTHADVTEDHSVCSDLNSRPESEINMNNSDMEESNSSEDESPNASQCSQPISTIHVTADQEAVSVEASGASLERSVEEVADCQAFPEVPETAEWEVLENPSEDFETRGQNEDDQVCDNAPESTQSYFHDEGSTHQGAMTQNEESPEISPDSIPAEEDIFLVKDSAEPLKTNGKDKDLHGFFSSGVNNDFWGSSLETGATYQPDDSYNEAAEQSNQNLGFGDNLVWGNLENPNVANGNSRMDIDSSKAAAAKEAEEQRPSEVKQFSRNVDEEELDHSEDSEDEGESWSSGEE
ncbi:nestin [Centroberyx gerrardi]